MTGPWNILRHVNVWSAVARKDGDGGGGGGGGDSGGDSGSSSKGKFEDSRSELEAKGYTVSDDGKSVYNDNGQVAGEGWSGSRTVDDIVSGGGGDSDSDSGGGETFGQAFARERAAKGPGQTFTYNGQVYSTDTAEDVAARNAAAQAEANRQAMLAAQMEEDRKTRAASEAAAVEADRIAKEEAAARMEAEAEAAAAEQERLRLEEAAASFEEEAEAAAAEQDRLRLEEAAASFEEEAEAADRERLPDVVTVPDFGDSDTEGQAAFEEQQRLAYEEMLARAEAAEELRTGQTCPQTLSRRVTATTRLSLRPTESRLRPRKSWQIWRWPPATRTLPTFF
jgi:hypothetical protein